MHVWTIDGVDTAGQQRRVQVRAQDEGQAAAYAAQHGITVHAVYIHNPAADQDDDALNALSAAASTPAASSKRTRPRADVSGVRTRLNAADTVLSIMGWLYILAPIAVIVAVSMSSDRRVPTATVLLYVMVIAGWAGAGVLLLGVGAAFRMLGVIGDEVTRK